MIKLTLDADNKITIDNSFQISLSYIKSEVSVSSIFMTMKNENLAFFLHSKFSHFVKIVYFSPILGEIYQVDKVLLNEDLDIFTANFFFEEDDIICAYVTQNQVLLQNFKEKSEHWEKEGEAEIYKNNIGIFIPDPEIKIKEKYVALLVSRIETDPSNILIWRRGEDNDAIYTAYKYPKNKSYWI